MEDESTKPKPVELGFAQIYHTKKLREVLATCIDNIPLKQCDRESATTGKEDLVQD